MTKATLRPTLAALVLLAALWCAPGAGASGMRAADPWAAARPAPAVGDIVATPLCEGFDLGNSLDASGVAPGRPWWLSRDPLGERGGLNLYGFVENDPVNKWDYLGMSPQRAGAISQEDRNLEMFLFQLEGVYALWAARNPVLVPAPMKSQNSGAQGRTADEIGHIALATQSLRGGSPLMMNMGEAGIATSMMNVGTTSTVATFELAAMGAVAGFGKLVSAGRGAGMVASGSTVGQARAVLAVGALLRNGELGAAQIGGATAFRQFVGSTEFAAFARSPAFGAAAAQLRGAGQLSPELSALLAEARLAGTAATASNLGGAPSRAGLLTGIPPGSSASVPISQLPFSLGHVISTDIMSVGRFKKTFGNLASEGFTDPTIYYVMHGGRPYAVFGTNRVLAGQLTPSVANQLRFQEVTLPFRGYKTPGDLIDGATESQRAISLIKRFFNSRRTP